MDSDICLAQNTVFLTNISVYFSLDFRGSLENLSITFTVYRYSYSPGILNASDEDVSL